MLYRKGKRCLCYLLRESTAVFWRQSFHISSKAFTLYTRVMAFGGMHAVVIECPYSTHWLTTKCFVTKIGYTWTIADFIIHVPDEEQLSINGPTICAQGSEVKWSLRLQSDADGDLLLEVTSQQSVNASVTACIYDVNNIKLCGFYTEMPRKFYPIHSMVSHRSKLIRRSDIMQDPGRYLSDNKLSVFCTLHYLEPIIHAADQLIEPSVYVPPRDKASFMENVLTGGQFSDVVVVAEKHEFPAHRAILAERSDVFRAMFHADMEEKRYSRVVLEDMTADAVSDLLTFIYTDTAPNVDTLALELLEAAEKYNILRLKAVCEAELAKRLDIDNVIDRLIQADMYGASQLREAALQWITKRAPDIVATEHWKTLCEERPDLLKIICEQFASYINHLKTGVPTEKKEQDLLF